MRACSIILEPPAALIAVTGSTEPLQELFYDADVGLCFRGRGLAIAALETRCPDDVTGAHSTPDDDLGAVKRCLFEGRGVIRRTWQS